MAPRPTRVPRLFGHPWHAALVHFPMTLLALPLPLDLVALLTGDAAWWTLSRACLGVGLAAAFVAAIAGFVDFATIPEGSPAAKTAMRHLSLMLVAVTFVAVNGWLRIDHAVPSGGAKMLAMALSVAGGATLLAGAWHGGELVYRYRVGQADSAPTAGPSDES